MKNQLVIDFETKSPVDLEKEGRWKYAHHPETDILMMSWKLNSQPAQIWFPGDQLFGFFTKPEDFVIYAHNAQFEHIIWNEVGVHRYGFSPIKIDNFIDIMALCGRYGLPQSLEKAGEVMRITHIKDSNGKRLLKLFSNPPYAPKTHPSWGALVEYCKMDAEAEYDLLNSLPGDHLSESEQWTWLHSCKVNATGIPVDVKSAAQILEVTDIYRNDQFDLLPDLTNNMVTKITQVKRIKDFINSKGVELENCQSDTLAELLEQDGLPDEVVMVAEMRAAIGLSSLGKYKRIQDMHYNGRIYDNQRFYGAHTGRFTGGGFQLLNLPRASVKDDEAEIGKFFDGSIMEYNPVKSARALIRPMVKASPGHAIMAADYSSIEYVVLEWFAGNDWALQRFAAGFDQYIDQATAMFGLGDGVCSKEQRQAGKVVILGCGYGLGARGLVGNAKSKWGMTLSFEEAGFMVKGYRKAHHLVVNMWYKMKDTVVAAIQAPGKRFFTHKCWFQVVKDRNGLSWLSITLPSSRSLYYMKPFLDQDTYGLVPCYWGLNQETKTWRPSKLIPGTIVENVVQAAARDILIDGMRALDREGFKIIGSIYDEVICEVPYDHGGVYRANDSDAKAPFVPDPNVHVLNEFCKYMCEHRPWSEGIPVRATGYIGPRYRKM